MSGIGRRARVAAAIAAAVVVAVAGAGCGEKEEKGHGQVERFDLTLDFYVNPDHAGIYTALERGLFEEAGLDVRPQVPSDPAAPIKQVAAGRADLAISYEPEVLLARDKGLDVVAVAALVQQPLSSLIALPESGVTGAASLEGKTLATAGIPYQDAFLESIMRRAHVRQDRLSVVDVGLGLLPAVLSGRADAMLGGFRNIEGVDLAERGKDPLVIPVDRLGIPTYDELVLVASEERLAEDPEEIRLFLAALERGTEIAVRDPALATEAVLSAGEGLDPKLTRAEIEATLPLLLPEGKNPYGFMDVGEWEEFIGFMADQGQIGIRFQPSDVLTNDLLPGRIPD
jgi:putative hydroxymethylpyrimidine transport system substrate-binding protein